MNSNTDLLKLHIGGSMAVIETMGGGNLFESLKIMKQLGTSYPDTIKNLYGRNGLYSLFYTGYFPYGMSQSFTKGIPFFYTYMTIKEYLESKKLSSNVVMGISGFSGGFAQGYFIAPTQRIKTLLLINPKISVMEMIQREKFGIFKGANLLSLRRSLDWSIRLMVMNKINNLKISNDKNINLIASSFVGGMCGLFTLPIDVIISRYQSSSSKNNNIVELINLMIKNEGIKVFTNGLGMRVFYSGWHTMWVAGVGTILYDKFKKKI